LIIDDPATRFKAVGVEQTVMGWGGRLFGRACVFFKDHAVAGLVELDP